MRRSVAATAASVVVILSAPAFAAPTDPGAAADAYGLFVNATLPLNVAVNDGPRSRASQEYPPQAAEPSEAELFSVGQVPSGGALVESIGVLQSFAGANSQPIAVAAAEATGVELINQAGTPLITADVLRAVSTTDCTAPPSAAGTDFVNVRVAGFTDPIPTPEPNTVLLPQVFDPLGIRVILNEQRQAADGRGLVVNAIHITSVADPTIPALFTGDIVVAHAMSTVSCPNGAPSTGDQNSVFIVKNADKARAKPGETVTYTANIQNRSDEPCDVHQVIEHLPVAFDFGSTSGALGTTATTVARPGGGTDVVIEPVGVTIAPDASVTKTYVVTVNDAAVPGTYFNNVEIYCSDLGNWVKGLDAPVEVFTEDEPVEKPECDDGTDNDGDGKVDFPADPGCVSLTDDDESDQLPRTGGPEDLSGPAALLIVAAWVARRKATA